MNGLLKQNITWEERKSNMVKSCREIEKDINDLKRKIQQNKLIEYALAGISERQKCDSNNTFEMCGDCHCWKIREKIRNENAVESRKEI